VRACLAESGTETDYISTVERASMAVHAHVQARGGQLRCSRRRISLPQVHGRQRRQMSDGRRDGLASPGGCTGYFWTQISMPIGGRGGANGRQRRGWHDWRVGRGASSRGTGGVEFDVLSAYSGGPCHAS
jgi:hypothetical protein